MQRETRNKPPKAPLHRNPRLGRLLEQPKMEWCSHYESNLTLTTARRRVHLGAVLWRGSRGAAVRAGGGSLCAGRASPLFDSGDTVLREPPKPLAGKIFRSPCVLKPNFFSKKDQRIKIQRRKATHIGSAHQRMTCRLGPSF